MPMTYPTPVSFQTSNAGKRPLVRATFHDDPDVQGIYECRYPASWAHLLEEAELVAKLAQARADLIWANGAAEETRTAAIALMLTVLGFRIHD